MDVDKKKTHALLSALSALPPVEAEAALRDAVTADSRWRVAHPVNDCVGADEIFDKLLLPLRRAFGSLRRRDDIFIGGASRTGSGRWIAALGHYVGNFREPLFGIAPHGRLAFLRYGEFYRIDDDGAVVEARLLIDFLDLLRQTGRSALPPLLGTEMLFPAPASHDGVRLDADADGQGQRSAELVETMLADLRHYEPGTFQSRGQEGGYWHADMLWYGPAGIGSNYTYDGFQRDHRIPFLIAFPDRVGGNHYARFGDGDYVCSGGWPSLTATHLGEYLGVAPTGKKIGMRIMDFWRVGDGQIRENWVLIDVPELFLQLGVDLFADV